MKITYDIKNGRSELSSTGRALDTRPGRLNQFSITALLLVVLAGTIGFWCWAVWWGASKLIGSSA